VSDSVLQGSISSEDSDVSPEDSIPTQLDKINDKVVDTVDLAREILGAYHMI